MFNYPEGYMNTTLKNYEHTTLPLDDRWADRMDSLINLCNGIKMLSSMGEESRLSIISILEEIMWRIQTLIDDHCIEKED